MWQPIETAPRDGTTVLGYKDGDFAAVIWEYGYWALNVAGYYAEDDAWEPTHWMPLPNPPESV